MPYTDLPLHLARKQRCTLPKPDDLVAFWQETLTLAREDASPPTFDRYRSDLYAGLIVDDVTFSGSGGEPVKAWLIRPDDVAESLPCVVRFIGYGGGRGIPAEHVFFPAVGFATLVMDTRSQGAVIGETPDGQAGDSGAEQPGWMTRGIASKKSYFYRRVFTDAVRAVETAASHPAINESEVLVAGRSQGGGIALAAAALSDQVRVRACWAAVPFLSDYRHAIGIASAGPYLELVDYLASRPDRIGSVERTLAYFDCAVLAELIECPTVVTVGLMDPVCPPSSVFSAFNAIASTEKEVRVFEFSTHATPPQTPEEELEFFKTTLGGRQT